MRKPPRSEEIYLIVGQRVAQRRREMGASQTDLAKRCDLARGTIANIEAARQHPTLHTLFVIANALDCDVQALLPTRLELERFRRGLSEPRLTRRMKRVAGGSAPEVAVFITKGME